MKAIASSAGVPLTCIISAVAAGSSNVDGASSVLPRNPVTLWRRPRRRRGVALSAPSEATGFRVVTRWRCLCGTVAPDGCETAMGLARLAVWPRGAVWPEHFNRPARRGARGLRAWNRLGALFSPRTAVKTRVPNGSARPEPCAMERGAVKMRGPSGSARPETGPAHEGTKGASQGQRYGGAEPLDVHHFRSRCGQ